MRKNNFLFQFFSWNLNIQELAMIFSDDFYIFLGHREVFVLTKLFTSRSFKALLRLECNQELRMCLNQTFYRFSICQFPPSTLITKTQLKLFHDVLCLFSHTFIFCTPYITACCSLLVEEPPRVRLHQASGVRSHRQRFAAPPVPPNHRGEMDWLIEG